MKNLIQNSTFFMVILFVLSLMCRLIFYLYQFEVNLPDADLYTKLANEFGQSGKINNEKVMPLYPIIKHFSLLIGDDKIIDILLSSLLPLLVYWLSNKLFSINKLSILAGFIMALHPFSIFYSTSGLSESTFTFALVLGVLLMYDTKTFYYGVVTLTLSILIRPTCNIILFPLILMFLIFIHKLSIAQICKNTAISFLIYILIMSPWWIHNYSKYSVFVPLNLGGGSILYEGNNFQNQTGGPAFDRVDYSKYEKINDLVKRDKEMKKDAVTFIFENKLLFLKVTVKRFLRFWNPTLNQNLISKQAFILIPLYTLMYFGLILFLFLIRKDQMVSFWPILLIIIFITFIHTITVGSVRYRYPTEPFLVILSIIGYYQLLKNFSLIKSHNG